MTRTLTGRVLTTAGRPIPNALFDFWQCDARGVYDNVGYRFRGHQLTNAATTYTVRNPYLYNSEPIRLAVRIRRGGWA